MSTLTSLKFTLLLVVVMANEKPLTLRGRAGVGQGDIKAVVRRTGDAVMSAMPKTRPAGAGGQCLTNRRTC